MEEAVQFSGEFRSESRDFSDLLHTCRAQSIDISKVPQEGRAPHVAQANDIIQHALANFFRAQQRIVGVRKPVRFIAHPLQQIQPGMVERQIERRPRVGKNDGLVLLREPDDRRRSQIQRDCRPWARPLPPSATV